ncbi:tetratricopeptide repeat protein [Jannaschia pohangensis]|uniref:Tetratricopeptide repeat-containing protein n=1 Tax=Jannaschia pohangensis TaxID=390807 RepID=A0A1I3IPE2_9RHOB|nr:tetratricopeptide repeat protein [Jannaschia pohangensis]SFI49759.1 Tetratricopeptide repeat-containing protein [Jannaschia pohangensis]
MPAISVPLVAASVKLLAAALAFAEAPGLKSGHSVYDAATKLLKAKPKRLTALAGDLTHAAETLFADFPDTPPDAAALFSQMVEATLPDAPALAKAKLDPATACDAMLGKLTDPEHLRAPMPDLFRDLVTPTLTAMLGNRDVIADIEPALWAEVLQTGNRIDETTTDTNQRVRELQADMTAKIDRLIAEKEQVARDLHIKEGMLIGLARNYAQNASDFESALAGLQLALETAARQQARNALPSNLGEAVDSVIAKVDDLNDQDQMAAADDLLRAEMNRLDAEIEERKAVQSRIIDKAIAQAIYQADADALADRTLRRIQLDGPSREDQFKRLRHEVLRRYNEGLRTGVPFVLNAAIGLARRCIDIAPTPYLEAMAQNDLANALQTKGTRTEGPEGAKLLAEAVTAFRASFDVCTRMDHPVEWAVTQNNLAISLRNQGIRTDGLAGAELLADAVTAYRAALEVSTRTDHPVEWAVTQNNLAGALQSQGTRTEGPAGAKLLAEAVTACRAALEVYTRTDHPVEWAMTQNNLAISLRNQGIRTDGLAGAELLAEAVAAFRAALEVRTRANHPVQWAQTQNNLANALSDQGNRTEGPAGADLLAEAVTACRAALEVRTRADHPADWAGTHHNLALALLSRADHDTTTDPRPDLTEALAAVEAALTVFDPVNMSFNHTEATRLRDAIKTRLDALPPR